MSAKMNCPVCGSDMRNRSMLAHYSMKPYRVCPDCQAKYTVDTNTRKRRLLIAIFAMTTLMLSVASYLHGFPWTLATFMVGTALFIYVGYALSRMTYVEYPDR